MIINGINYNELLQDAQRRIHNKIDLADKFTLISDGTIAGTQLFYNGMHIKGVMSIALEPLNHDGNLIGMHLKVINPNLIVDISKVKTTMGYA